MKSGLEIRKGTPQDLDELGRLYDELNEYLESHTNYPGWIKGIYPTRESAAEGVEEDGLFVACLDRRIAGAVILGHRPEEAYRLADWHTDLDYRDIYVVHTLAVHPEFLHKGVGRQIMEFILLYAAKMNGKAVRLDVYEKNIPAIRLYESYGFRYIDTVDMGLGMHGLDWFKLYQKIL